MQTDGITFPFTCSRTCAKISLFIGVLCSMCPKLKRKGLAVSSVYRRDSTRDMLDGFLLQFVCLLCC